MISFSKGKDYYILIHIFIRYTPPTLFYSLIPVFNTFQLFIIHIQGVSENIIIWVSMKSIDIEISLFISHESCEKWLSAKKLIWGKESCNFCSGLIFWTSLYVSISLTLSRTGGVFPSTARGGSIWPALV